MLKLGSGTILWEPCGWSVISAHLKGGIQPLLGYMSRTWVKVISPKEIRIPMSYTHTHTRAQAMIALGGGEYRSSFSHQHHAERCFTLLLFSVRTRKNLGKGGKKQCLPLCCACGANIKSVKVLLLVELIQQYSKII